MEGMKLVEGAWWPMSRMGVVDVDVVVVGMVVGAGSFEPRTCPPAVDVLVEVEDEVVPVPFMRVLSWKVDSVRMEVICASWTSERRAKKVAELLQQPRISTVAKALLPQRKTYSR